MTSLMNFLKTLVLVVVPLGMTAWIVPQGAAQPPLTKEQKEWVISKPDDRELRGKNFDPRLSQVLEEIRVAANQVKERQIKNSGRNPVPSYAPNWNCLAAQYISLLRQAGMMDAAEKILTSAPEPDRQRGEQDIRSMLQNFNMPTAVQTQPVKLNTQMVAERLLSMNINDFSGCYCDPAQQPGGIPMGYVGYSVPVVQTSTVYSGYAPYSSYPQPQPVNNESQDDSTRYKSYREWAENFIEKHQPNVEEALREIRGMKDNDRNSYFDSRRILGYAVLFSVVGHQEDAKQTIADAMELAKSSALRQVKDRDDYLVKDDTIRDTSFWENVVNAQIRMREYDEAVKTIEAMRESMTKLQMAGEDVQWSRSWNNMFANLAKFTAQEESLDKGLSYLDKIMRTSERDNVLNSLAQTAAKQGKEDDVKKILALTKNNYGYGREMYQYDLVMYKVKNGKPEEALAALKSLLDAGENRGTALMYLSPPQKNEVGLLFLKHDDAENARKIFVMVNDQLKMTESNSKNPQNQMPPEQICMEAANAAKMLAARCKNGLAEETLAFVNTFKEPKFCAPFFAAFASEIATDDNQTQVKQLLDKAFQSAMQLEPNPDGVLPTNMGPYPRPYFRNDALWEIARFALAAQCVPEAERAIREAEKLDAKLPKIDSYATPGMGMGGMPFSNRDNQWQICFQTMMQKKDLTSALVIARVVKSPDMRVQFYSQIAAEMIRAKGESTKSDAKPDLPDVKKINPEKKPAQVKPSRRVLMKPTGMR
ncbi:MAG: hypothetical protein FWC50_04940 [Planctomycetaceae bacterium]|nr:hypothetical protein [Planctomycetaceae bacterium]